MPSSASNPLLLLAELLSSTQAKPIVSPERLAASAFYDLHYRIFLIGATFETHAKESSLYSKRIQSARLKLLQFVASRSWLLPVIRNWSDSQGDAQLSMLSSQKLRRGFLADSMFDDVLDYLEATGLVVRVESHVQGGVNVEFMQQYYRTAVELGLFAEERSTLQELESIKITNSMLEGW